MRTDKRISSLLLLGLFYLCPSGCKEKGVEALFIEDQHDQIMVIHDDVMPKMRDIYNLKKKMKKDANLKESPLLDSLEYADELMMQWMHDYKRPSAKDADYEAYLSTQMDEIKEVRDAMLRIIDKSETALNL